MTVDNNTWQALAEKYDTKAKWAEAILFLNTNEHEDLISALIELGPEDLVKKPENLVLNFSPPASLDPDDFAREMARGEKVRRHRDEKEVMIDKTQKALDIATAAAQEASEALARLDDLDAQFKVDPEDIKALKKAVIVGLKEIGNVSG